MDRKSTAMLAATGQESAMKILAVDDDPLTLELLAAAMAAVGYSDVTVAGSAEEAHEIVVRQREPFGCFLVDIQMPGTDGIELCRALRKMPDYRVAPIIMVTAMSGRPFLDRAFAAGASDYVTKPFDLTELGARVRAAERQFTSDQRVRNNAAALRALRVELEESQRVELSDPVTLTDVKGAIDYLAMENYLLRLSRGDLFATSLFTFQIERVDRLHRQSSPTLFRDLLSDVADAILTALTGTQCLLAYAGGGTYAAIVSGGFGLDTEELATLVNQAAAELWLLDDDGRQLDVTVAVGAPDHLGVMTSGKSAVNGLRVAIERTRFGAASSDLYHMPRKRAGLGFIGSFLKAI